MLVQYEVASISPWLMNFLWELQNYTFCILVRCPKTLDFSLCTLQKNIFQAPPKGPNQPYDPMYWDEFMVSEYGGYTAAEGGRGKGGPRGAPPGRGMGMGGMRGR